MSFIRSAFNNITSGFRSAASNVSRGLSNFARGTINTLSNLNPFSDFQSLDSDIFPTRPQNVNNEQRNILRPSPTPITVRRDTTQTPSITINRDSRPRNDTRELPPMNRRPTLFRNYSMPGGLQYMDDDFSFDQFNTSEEALEDFINGKNLPQNINYEKISDSWSTFIDSSNGKNAFFPKLQRDEEIVDNLDDADYIQFYNPVLKYTHYVNSKKYRNFNQSTGRMDINVKTDENDDNHHLLFNNVSVYRLLHNPTIMYRFVKILKTEKKRERSGGFFPYFIKEEVPFSLSKYGIYKKSEWLDIP